MPGRFAFILGALLAALCGWNWSQARNAEPPIAPAPPKVAPGLYDVEVSNVVTTIELPEPAAACDLIISSLGISSETYGVQLAAEECRARSCARLRVISDVHPPASFPARTIDNAGVDHGTGPYDAVASTGCASADRTYHLHVADLPLEDQRGYVRIEASLAGEGRAVRVFLDRQLTPADLAPGLVDAIIEELDERVIPRSRSFLGTHRDVDGDGKLAILLTPWLGRLEGGKTSVRGFVRSSDFRPDGDAPFGIRSDVIYLNSAIRPDAALAALLAHEYTHAVCCSLRLSPHHACSRWPNEEDWLNEAIAHVAEQQHGAGWSNLDRRVRAYLEDPERTPLLVADYFREGLWRNHACRGATFLFLQCCADTFGPGLLHELAVHPATGVAKLEAITGEPFEALYRRWTISLHRGRLESVDLQGPMGECRLHGPCRHRWSPAEGPLELELRGTATSFVRIDPAPGAKSRFVTLRAQPEARLQVTLVQAR